MDESQNLTPAETPPDQITLATEPETVVVTEQAPTKTAPEPDPDALIDGYEAVDFEAWKDGDVIVNGRSYRVNVGPNRAPIIVQELAREQGWTA